jgi:hypothetical protein
MDHSINTLGAAIKALDDVVAPAVDPADPLATEQLRLVSESLAFLRSRLPYLHDRSVLELQRSLALGSAIAEAAAPVASTAPLSRVIAEGSAVLDDRRASHSEIDVAAARIGAEIRNMIRLAATFDDAVRSTIERAVLADLEGSLDFYRAWYVPLGFDPRPDSVPTVADALTHIAVSDVVAEPR